MEVLIIFIHQIVFQGMFVIKNVSLRKTSGKRIRGNNKEVRAAFVYFTAFITTSLILGLFKAPIGRVSILNTSLAWIIGLVLLSFNLVIALVSLAGMKDSWRVGVLEDQKTELISSGIFRFSRNPYFLSYQLMLSAYAVLLQNIILFILAVLGFFVIHNMVRKEEAYLLSIHGDHYQRYKNRVPRYLFR